MAIINKIEGGKNCLRDFESLIERMQRINAKDMINRYIISGIKTIIRLGKEKDIYDVRLPLMQLRLIEKLEKEEDKLKQRIFEELDTMEDFEQGNHAAEELIDTYEYRRRLIKKIYRIIKNKEGLKDFGEMRAKAVRECEKYLNGETNVANLIRFVKQRMDVNV